MSLNDNFYTAEPGGLSLDRQTADDLSTCECPYCHADVPNTLVASPSDGDWWAIEATHHATACEWVASRAFGIQG